MNRYLVPINIQVISAESEGPQDINRFPRKDIYVFKIKYKDKNYIGEDIKEDEDLAMRDILKILDRVADAGDVLGPEDYTKIRKIMNMCSASVTDVIARAKIRGTTRTSNSGNTEISTSNTGI